MYFSPFRMGAGRVGFGQSDNGGAPWIATRNRESFPTAVNSLDISSGYEPAAEKYKTVNGLPVPPVLPFLPAARLAETPNDNDDNSSSSNDNSPVVNRPTAPTRRRWQLPNSLLAQRTRETKGRLDSIQLTRLDSTLFVWPSREPAAGKNRKGAAVTLRAAGEGHRSLDERHVSLVVAKEGYVDALPLSTVFNCPALPSSCPG